MQPPPPETAATVRNGVFLRLLARNDPGVMR